MKCQYTEIVTTEVETTCTAYAASLGVEFEGPVEQLGNAYVATAPSGQMLGVRSPMHETETPVTRPYWLVSDIHQAIKQVEHAGAEIAHPPMQIPGYGWFAIYFLGGNQHGFWQL